MTAEEEEEATQETLEMDDDAEVDDAQFPLGLAENKKASAGDFDMLKVIGKVSFGKVRGMHGAWKGGAPAST